MKRKSKLLAAAIALLSFSAAASVTGTVAWFTAANTVSVTSMNIQAETEEGILVSNEGKTEWKTTIAASHNGQIGDPKAQAKFIPTSTIDANTWYRNNAGDEAISTATGTYLQYTTNETPAGAKITITDGVGSIDTDQNTETVDDTKNIFLLNKFYLKSTSGELTGQTLYLNKVDISSRAADLHDAIRVLVKYGTEIKIYGFSGSAYNTPISGGINTAPTLLVQGTTKNETLGTNVTIPANNTNDPLEISIYAWFEGEDQKCTSKKATEDHALEALAISAQFGTKTIA